MVKLLTQCDADPFIKDMDGRIAVELASSSTIAKHIERVMLFKQQIRGFNCVYFHSVLPKLDEFCDVMGPRHIMIIARQCRPRLSDGRTLQDIRIDEEQDALDLRKKNREYLQTKTSLETRKIILSSDILIREGILVRPVRTTIEDRLRAQTKAKTKELLSRVTKSRTEMKAEIKRRDTVAPGWRNFLKTAFKPK